LWINNDTAEIYDAKNLWGKDTYKTEDIIRQGVGMKDAEVAVIGLGDKNLVKFVVIENKYWGWLGRTGGGATISFKKIKRLALAVSLSKVKRRS